MPGLADLHSALENLPFGKDKPGGGNSDQPYVKVAKGHEWNPGNINDGLFVDGITGAVTATAADVERITKWLADHPLFVGRQVGLQLSNVELEHREDRQTDKPTSGQGFFNNTINFLSNTGAKILNDVGPTRIYTPTNTLAEIGTVAFGEHFERHGFSPVMDDRDKYEAIVKDNNENGANRLVKLSNQMSDPDSQLVPIAKYKGGPGSRYGIGDTTINRADGVNSFTGQDNTEEKRTTLLRSFIPIPMQKLLQIDRDGKIDTQTPTVLQDGSNVLEFDKFNFRKEDFRKYKNSIKQIDQKELPSSDYEKNNMERRIGIARTRTESEYAPDYMIPVYAASDKINGLGLFYSDRPNDGLAYQDKDTIDIVTDAKVRDLVKFRIKALDNDHPGSGVYMVFRAFLNDLNRRIDAKWNEYSYVGRGESFFLYDGFRNILSFEFTIAALSRMEMKPLYQKLNYLYSTLTPDYKANKMRGNLVELTIGDYIKYQPGIITSMYIGIPEETNWEIAIGEPDSDSEKDKDMHELPMLLKVAINFIPLWNFLPHKSAEAPFFGIDDTENPGKDTPKNWTYNMNSYIQKKQNPN